MSFIKIYKKDWSILNPPSKGSYYVGYDKSNNWGFGVNTLLQMDDNGIVSPINSGSTNISNTLSGLTDTIVNNVVNGEILVYSNGFWVNSGNTNGINGFEPNSGIKYNNLSDKYLQTIYNTNLDPSLSTPYDVGGIEQGTIVSDISGKTIVQIIDDLLFPTILPTYTIPSMNLIINPSGIYEVGINLVISISGYFIKNDAGDVSTIDILKNNTVISSTNNPSVSNESDISPQFGYIDPNNPNKRYTLNINDSINIPSTINTNPSVIRYTSKCNYNAGLVKKNNKGNNDIRSYQIRNVDAPQNSDIDFYSYNRYLYGYYPYYYGKTINESSPSDIVTIIESGSGYTKIVGNGDNTLIMNFNCNGEWPWFAIFEPYQNKNIWYENALNNGNIGTSYSDLFSSGTTLSINSPDNYWNNIDFKIYVAQKVTTIGNCEIRE